MNLDFLRDLAAEAGRTATGVFEPVAASVTEALADVDGPRALIALCGLVVAGVVKGATGIGYASCALPFLVVTLGLTTAMGLVVVPAMASNFVLLLTAGHLQETVGRFWPLYAAIVGGIVLGVLALAAVPQAMASQLLGVLIVLYTIQAGLNPNLALGRVWARRLQVPVGLANGFVTGLTGSQVIPLLPYMLALGLESSRFIQAVNVAIILSSAILGLGLIGSGMLSAKMLALSTLAVVPALAGVQLGVWARAHIRERHFKKLVLIVLAVLGCLLIAR